MPKRPKQPCPTRRAVGQLEVLAGRVEDWTERHCPGDPEVRRLLLSARRDLTDAFYRLHDRRRAAMSG